MHPWLFLDRDGTLIRDKHYLHSPEQVELIPQAVTCLLRLQKMGVRFIVVTNQSGVGRGYFKESSIARVHDRLDQLLEKKGLVIEAYYYCPHTPSDGCACRKPNIELGERALKAFDIDSEQAAMVGDKQSDIDFGVGLGFAKQFWVTPKGEGWDLVTPWW